MVAGVVPERHPRQRYRLGDARRMRPRLLSRHGARSAKHSIIMRTSYVHRDCPQTQSISAHHSPRVVSARGSKGGEGGPCGRSALRDHTSASPHSHAHGRQVPYHRVMLRRRAGQLFFQLPRRARSHLPKSAPCEQRHTQTALSGSQGSPIGNWNAGAGDAPPSCSDEE